MRSALRAVAVLAAVTAGAVAARRLALRGNTRLVRIRP